MSIACLAPLRCQAQRKLLQSPITISQTVIWIADLMEVKCALTKKKKEKSLSALTDHSGLYFGRQMPAYKLWLSFIFLRGHVYVVDSFGEFSNRACTLLGIPADQGCFFLIPRTFW